MTSVLVLASVAGGQTAGRAVEAAATRPVATALEVSPWEERVAALLLETRDAPDRKGPSCAERLAFLGAEAAPALLDALISGRVVPDPVDASRDVVLRGGEPACLRAALVRIGRAALLPLARQGAGADASTLARQRALLTLELVGVAEDLELAAAATAAEQLDTLCLQRALQAATAEIARRDAGALRQLRHLLEGASDPTCTGLVRGVAGCARREVLTTLADELDRQPRHEPLLLSEIARAAADVAPPIDPRVLIEVRERLTSSDPLLARTAATAAGVLGDFEAVQALIGLLDSDVRGVRGEAHGALQRITAMGYSAEPAAWSAWLERERAWYERRVGDLAGDLAASDPGRALAALREIAAHRYRRHELAALVAPALDHAHPVVRSAACSTLAALGSHRVAQHLHERLEDEDAGVARAARTSLDGLRGKAASGGTD